MDAVYAGGTTTELRAGDVAAFLGGFVAAEGCFTSTRIAGRTRFRFAVSLGARDRCMCEMFHDFLGVGTVYTSPRRRPHYDDEVTFAVQAIRDLAEVVVPFMDAHLMPSHKREQYLSWRSQLLARLEERKAPPPCEVDGCGKRRRARGVCRLHHCLEFGQ